MQFSSQYFSDAQKVIMGVLKGIRPELMANHGKDNYETKKDESVVTKLDKHLEILLKEALSKYDKSVGFLGEEHGREGNEKSYWLIDPIDGTESFIRGLSGCRNILTFIDDDEPKYAIAYRFTTDDLFVAQLGKPTTKNGRPVKLSERPLSRSWIEFSVNMREPDGYRIYQELRPKIAGITVHGDYLAILEGAVEGILVYKSPGDEWDYAPRALMIAGAGGRVANIGSATYDFHDKRLVATTPVIFDDVMKITNGALGQ